MSRSYRIPIALVLNALALSTVRLWADRLLNRANDAVYGNYGVGCSNKF
jgi:hypothetical protein